MKVDHLEWLYVEVICEQDVSKDVMSRVEWNGLSKCKKGLLRTLKIVS